MAKPEYLMIIFTLICGILSLGMGMLKNPRTSQIATLPPDYDRLADLISFGAWQKAERQTYRMMLLILGKKNQELTPKDIAKFPCQELSQIDQTWYQASQGEFSLTRQHQIWQKFQQLDPDNPLTFASLNSFIKKSNICRDSQSPNSSAILCHEQLNLAIFSRLQKCQISPPSPPVLETKI
ncbi:GUN4 domain-containing protein [Arthrospira platensis]|jgi:hypothetical protein|uniref:GUN4-like domain-containing protein n=1 Tax=Limnospira platensis NIES-46 TaxID=1236695 RepID=A0A5M3TCE6_LIMPL|nr:GUN4 domain-containing protein [Arthrospira platensis]AMW27134.1 hypothetical protein AP285_03180 [Arthrospira platensis YZ]KDR55411.1 hypothetical protein APPUASWS_022640 [Arthrospira platensis str. Paraca]MBD2670200.1 GUN4 domain-containing protein [Arthrospira platensis FACHB-439]MBD2710884.1 GUN4 domain-containing protein [Arthrospira platensis FACHB-835]MDF2211386.1 GUN4 domain-containing protein [Arthrospira platensis NCB002]MDT9183373.1 GUN4 domain-containing protein [Limnospira sp.